MMMMPDSGDADRLARERREVKFEMETMDAKTVATAIPERKVRTPMPPSHGAQLGFDFEL